MNAVTRTTPKPTPVPSPCISVCSIDAQTQLCKGCFRTIDEIANWASMSDANKQAVWAQLSVRRSAARTAG